MSWRRRIASHAFDQTGRQVSELIHGLQRDLFFGGKPRANLVSKAGIAFGILGQEMRGSGQNIGRGVTSGHHDGCAVLDEFSLGDTTRGIDQATE